MPMICSIRCILFTALVFLSSFFYWWIWSAYNAVFFTIFLTYFTIKLLLFDQIDSIYDRCKRTNEEKPFVLLVFICFLFRFFFRIMIVAVLWRYNSKCNVVRNVLMGNSYSTIARYIAQRINARMCVYGIVTCCYNHRTHSARQYYKKFKTKKKRN